MNINDFRPRRTLLIAAAGGLAGFLVIQLAVAIVFVAALLAGGFTFGGGIHSWKDSLFIAIFVPTLISLGAAIPAWVLGAKWWHGLLAGIIAMIVFIYVESNGGKQVNYSVFSQRETLAYVSTALVSVLIAVVGMKKLYPINFLLLTFVATLAGFSLVVLDMIEESYKVGFAVALLAWILSPLAATPHNGSDHN